MTTTANTDANASLFDLETLFEQRLLHGVEQSVHVRTPEPWRRLDPPTGAERAAAGVFLRLATEPTLAAMVARAKKTATETGSRREERGAQPIWLAVTKLLEGLPLDEQGQVARTLYDLALWSTFESSPLLTAFAGFGAERPQAPTREPFLAQLGRRLLQAQARHWAEADARRQTGPNTDANRAESLQ